MALPNPKELAVIKEFRCRLKDTLRDEELREDMFLIRWLRGDFNLIPRLVFGQIGVPQHILQILENMLRNNLKWRKEQNADSILSTKLDPYYLENFPRWIDGVDKQGRPIITMDFGKWDFRVMSRDKKSPEGFMMHITEGFEIALRAIAENNERLRSPENPHPVSQVVAILDFAGFPYAQLFNYKAIASLLQLGSMYEAYYPEILHASYFINCPFFISKVLNILRPVVAPKTMNKIKCLGAREQWQKEILAAISPEQIRPQFGGTMGITTSN